MKVSVQVKTHAKESKISPVEGKDNSFVVYISVPPIDGKANKEIIKLLGRYFKIAPSCITLVSGHTSKQKVFDVFL